jgi:signal transduction histidine kinase
VIGRGVRTLVGPRPGMLVCAALLVFGLLGAFAYVLVDSQAKSRRDAERSFATEATITSQLTSSLFTSSSAATQAAAAKVFGGSKPSSAALTALAKRSHLAYALIVGGNGKVLAASAGTSAAVLQREKAVPGHVRAALAGKPWLSDVLTGTGRSGQVIEWAMPFNSPTGLRVQIEGLNASVLFQFLHGYLNQAVGRAGRLGYVVDGRDRLVADSGGRGKLGDQLTGALVRAGGGRFTSNGTQRYVVSAPLQGSDWRVLLSEPTSSLYPALAGSRSWILFLVLAAFGLIGVTSIALLRRTLLSAARVVETNHQLAEMNLTLEERVVERTAVAEQRAQELARSNAELEQFASVASHDLQEPLRKIRMYCDRLPKRLGGGLSEDAASDMARMQNAAERMQRLIDDLLSFARVTSKDREFELIDLNQVINDVMGDLEARITELGARIEVGELPTVEADRAQMSQLFQNLISNALKFHRPGVAPIVRIRSQVVAAQPSRFSGEASVGTRCLISVEDNGIGFDGKYAERVFSAFERLHSRSDYEGTGIGLSIARKIAWRHRGDITATSTPGQGSTFTLTMPFPSNASSLVEERAA